MSKRVTQRDIAAEAGVDVSTVSLALRAHPRIPEATRERIEAIAHRLNYRPDPALSSIAAARWQGRRDAKGTTLAFIVDDLKAAEIELKLYLNGVRHQAELLGYHVEPFSLSDYPSSAALQRVIHARGIRGIVIGQSRQPLPPELFTESSIPVVQCGFLREVEGEVVRPDLRHAVGQALTHLRKSCYRIACVLPVEKNLHSDWIILGAVLVEAKMAPRGLIRPLVTAPAISAKDIAELKAMDPDAIITINEKHKKKLIDSWPEAAQRPLLTLHTLPPFEGKQGINLRLEEVGRASVNLLEMKMRNLPIAFCRQTLLIEPRRIENAEV